MLLDFLILAYDIEYIQHTVKFWVIVCCCATRT